MSIRIYKTDYSYEDVGNKELSEMAKEGLITVTVLPSGPSLAYDHQFEWGDAPYGSASATYYTLQVKIQYKDSKMEAPVTLDKPLTIKIYKE